MYSRTRAQADAVKAKNLKRQARAMIRVVCTEHSSKKSTDQDGGSCADPVKARQYPDVGSRRGPPSAGDTVLMAYDIDTQLYSAPPNKETTVLCSFRQHNQNEGLIHWQNLRLLKSSNEPAKDRFSQALKYVPSRMDVRPRNRG